MLFLMGLVSAIDTFQERPISVFLTSPVPNERRAADILEVEKNSKTPEDVCFYSDLGLVSISQKEYSRSSEVFAGVLLGNAAVFDWRLNGFGEDDKEGCVIDHKTAMELFGSASPGGQLSFQGQDYTVRKVLPWKQRVLFIRQGKDEVQYSRVFVWKNEDDFLIRHGLSGKIVHGEYVNIVMILFLILLPVNVILRLLKDTYHEGKEQGTMAQVIWLLLFVGVLGFLFWKLGGIFEIPGDWIPGKWSDFGFWQEKMKEMAEDLKIYLMLQKTPAETEFLISSGKAVFFSLGSYILERDAGKK